MIWLWVSFIAFVLLLLAMDLGIFHRHSHEVSVKESLIWVAVWATLSVSFSVFVYFLYEHALFGLAVPLDNSTGLPMTGQKAAVLYLTGYIIEQSLSMDNMFVIALILTFFAVPLKYQHRVLFWGIIGALVLRMIMILGGAALVHQFNWILYVFGAFLIYSAYRMMFGDGETDPSKNFLVKQVKKFLPVTNDFHGHRFIIHIDGRHALTPLALALLAVESADVIFAVDSIPAIFAITDIPFLIFTSNVFAILGLRSLYFALAGLMNKFRYLKVSLSILLAVIGAKMLLKDLLRDVPYLTYIMLALILLILAGGVVASMVLPKEEKPPTHSA